METQAITKEQAYAISQARFTAKHDPTDRRSRTRPMPRYAIGSQTFLMDQIAKTGFDSPELREMTIEDAVDFIHDETVSADEAAEQLGYLPKTFRSRIDRGQVEVIRLGPAVMISKAEVARLQALKG